jgi:drug/metabolite transporter (DMT)-like permease
MTHPRPLVLALCALLLFLVWSNSFVAVGYLVGSDRSAPRFDFAGLTVARFVPAAAICAVYCFGWRPRESVEVLRRHWRRLLVCGFLAVPGYNLALNFGQQQGVAAPVASLTTALVPLFVMLLAALFLGERLTAWRIAGFAVAAAGMVLVATRHDPGRTAYPLLVAVTALAPLCWSVFSVLSKPLAGRVPPVLWTYLAICVGGLMVLPILAGPAADQWRRLDLRGWAALAYLSLPCTVLGFALWTWLLRHLTVTSVGFTVFLNPPLTSLSKWTLAALWPTTFVFTIAPREWLGGALALAGQAIALRIGLAQKRPERGARA